MWLKAILKSELRNQMLRSNAQEHLPSKHSSRKKGVFFFSLSPVWGAGIFIRWGGIWGNKQVFGYKFLPWLIICIVEKVRKWPRDYLVLSGEWQVRNPGFLLSVQSSLSSRCKCHTFATLDARHHLENFDNLLRNTMPLAGTCWHWVGQVPQYSLFSFIKNDFSFIALSPIKDKPLDP